MEKNRGVYPSLIRRLPNSQNDVTRAQEWSIWKRTIEIPGLNRIPFASHNRLVLVVPAIITFASIEPSPWYSSVSLIHSTIVPSCFHRIYFFLLDHGKLSHWEKLATNWSFSNSPLELEILLEYLHRYLYTCGRFYTEAEAYVSTSKENTYRGTLFRCFISPSMKKSHHRVSSFAKWLKKVEKKFDKRVPFGRRSVIEYVSMFSTESWIKRVTVDFNSATGSSLAFRTLLRLPSGSNRGKILNLLTTISISSMILVSSLNYWIRHAPKCFSFIFLLQVSIQEHTGKGTKKFLLKKMKVVNVPERIIW